MILFDPATVGRGPKQRVTDLPGGASRVTTPPVGLRFIGDGLVSRTWHSLFQRRNAVATLLVVAYIVWFSHLSLALYYGYSQPPYDLADVHRRFVEHVLAANPGAAFRAACGYPIERKLKSLKAPLTVFAPHDDIIEQTLRVKPLLKPGATFVDLPELGQDPFNVALDRMVTLVNRHLPP